MVVETVLVHSIFTVARFISKKCLDLNIAKQEAYSLQNLCENIESLFASYQDELSMAYKRTPKPFNELLEHLKSAQNIIVCTLGGKTAFDSMKQFLFVQHRERLAVATQNICTTFNVVNSAIQLSQAGSLHLAISAIGQRLASQASYTSYTGVLPAGVMSPVLEADNSIVIIGAGVLADVHLFTMNDTHEKVAVKLFRVIGQQSEHENRFKKELKLLSKLDHPNIVRIHGGYLHHKRWGLVMEYLGRQPITALAGQLRTPAATFAALADALTYLHAQHIVHRDIKPDNVMFRDTEATPVFIDFELGTIDDTITRQLTQRVTRLYAAPEQFNGKGRITTKTDIYSFGLLMYEMLTGRKPFMGMVRNIEEIKQKGFWEPQANELPSRSWHDLILRCIDVEPNSRPDAWELSIELTTLAANEKGLLQRNGLAPLLPTAEAVRNMGVQQLKTVLGSVNLPGEYDFKYRHVLQQQSEMEGGNDAAVAADDVRQSLMELLLRLAGERDRLERLVQHWTGEYRLYSDGQGSKGNVQKKGGAFELSWQTKFVVLSADSFVMYDCQGGNICHKYTLVDQSFLTTLLVEPEGDFGFVVSGLQVKKNSMHIKSQSTEKRDQWLRALRQAGAAVTDTKMQIISVMCNSLSEGVTQCMPNCLSEEQVQDCAVLLKRVIIDAVTRWMIYSKHCRETEFHPANKVRMELQSKADEAEECIEAVVECVRSLLTTHHTFTEAFSAHLHPLCKQTLTSHSFHVQQRMALRLLTHFVQYGVEVDPGVVADKEEELLDLFAQHLNNSTVGIALPALRAVTICVKRLPSFNQIVPRVVRSLTAIVHNANRANANAMHATDRKPETQNEALLPVAVAALCKLVLYHHTHPSELATEANLLPLIASTLPKVETVIFINKVKHELTANTVASDTDGTHMQELRKILERLVQLGMLTDTVRGCVSIILSSEPDNAEDAQTPPSALMTTVLDEATDPMSTPLHKS